MAASVQCDGPGQHFYDSEKHTSCPHCGVQGLDLSKTRPLQRDATRSGSAGSTQPMRGTAPGSTQPQAGGGEAARGAKTKGVFEATLGADPVVGWLVCIKGAHYGCDFRLHSEKNFIGRDRSSDVCLSGDDHVSGRAHAVLSFEPQSCKYKIRGGEGRGLTYLNGEDVDSPIELKAFDRLRLGESELVFIPLCDNEHFQWEPNED